jgi:hypothetical protein
MTAQTHTPDDPSSKKPIERRSRWENSKVPERRCTAHKRNGDRCGNPAIHGGTVCGYHGGNAPAVKAKARLRLEMATDKLARELLGMTSDPSIPEGVRLSAIKDALDRGGIQSKTAVSVEVSTKPFELVFDSIVSARPDAEPRPALVELESPGESELESGDESSDVIIGEIDDDEIPEDYPEFHREPESDSDYAEVVDIEIDTGYTDAIPSGDAEVVSELPGPLTPDDSSSFVPVDLSGSGVGPLGMNGPVGSGLMSLEDAVAAQREMNRRAITRNARRR